MATTRETLVAEVQFRTDENSMRKAAASARRAQDEWTKSLREASNNAARQFQGQAWQRDMLHTGPNALPRPGFMDPKNDFRAPVMSSVPYGPFRQQSPEIVRRANTALQSSTDGFIDRSYMTARAYRGQISALEATSAAAKKSRDGVLQLSYALQDFQAAGIRGVMNNIPNVAQGLGMSGKAAGALLMGGVAGQFWADTVIPNIKADFGITTDADRERIKKDRAEADDVMITEQRKAAQDYLESVQQRIRRANEADKDLLDAFNRDTKSVEAKRRTERAYIETLNGSARIEAESAQVQKEIAEDSARAKTFHSRRLDSEIALRDTLTAESAAMASQMAELEKRPKVSFSAQNSRGQMVNVMKRDAVTEQEIAVLQQKRDATEAAYAAVQERIKNRQQVLAGIVQDTTVIAGQTKAAYDIQIRQQKGRETAERALREQEAVAALTEERRRIHEKEREAMDRIHKSMREFNDKLRAGLDSDRETEIQNLRKRGHGARADRLQRGLDRDKRIRDLMDGKNGPPMNRADAEAQADAESSRARGKVGVRTPQADRPSALDGDPFAPQNFRPETPALDEARRPRAKPKPVTPKPDPAAQGKPAEEKTATAIKAMSDRLSGKLDEVKNSLKTPAEKIAPVGSGG